MKLTGKTAFVTGGSRSIGRAIALALAREGADVAIGYVAHQREAAQVTSEIAAMGRGTLAIQGDISVRQDVERMVATTIETLGAIDILVNNAGILTRTPFLDIEEREWERIFAVNMKGTFLVSQQVARHMVERQTGSIVNISSAGVRRPNPNLAHYQASKGAISTFTQNIALELAPFHIRANVIEAGLIETDLNRHNLTDPDFRAGRIASIPLGLVGTPEDVAAGCVYLASDDARLVTGSVLTVDGGVSIG